MKLQQSIKAAILERQLIAAAAVQASDHEYPGSVLTGYSPGWLECRLMAGTASSRPFH
jgi:hypothetical protein